MCDFRLAQRAMFHAELFCKPGTDATTKPSSMQPTLVSREEEEERPGLKRESTSTAHSPPSPPQPEERAGERRLLQNECHIQRTPTSTRTNCRRKAIMAFSARGSFCRIQISPPASTWTLLSRFLLSCSKALDRIGRVSTWKS